MITLLGENESESDFDRAFSSLEEQKLLVNIQSNSSSSDLYRINLNMLKHLIRAEFISETICDDKNSSLYESAFRLFSSSLTHSSWNSKKQESISIKRILSEQKITNENSFRDGLEMLADENLHISLKTEDDSVIIKNNLLVDFFRTEYLENYIVSKLGLESLRILKAIQAIPNNTEKVLQEFCLLPTGKFRELLMRLIDSLYISNFFKL